MIVGRIGRTRSSYFIIIFDCLSRERGEKGEAVLQIYCDCKTVGYMVERGPEYYGKEIADGT